MKCPDRDSRFGGGPIWQTMRYRTVPGGLRRPKTKTRNVRDHTETDLHFPVAITIHQASHIFSILSTPSCCADMAASYSAAHRTPPELLRDIFVQASYQPFPSLTQLEIPFFCDKSDPPLAKQLTRQNIDGGLVPSQPHTAEALSLVCRHWRYVALGCPELWTTIHSGCSRALAKACLKRSAGRPLRIWVDIALGSQDIERVILSQQERFEVLHITCMGPDDYSKWEDFPDQMMIRRIADLANYSSRLRVLSIKIPQRMIAT